MAIAGSQSSAVALIGASPTHAGRAGRSLDIGSGPRLPRGPDRVSRLERFAPALDALSLFGGFGVGVAGFGIGRVGILRGAGLASVGVPGGRRCARWSRWMARLAIPSEGDGVARVPIRTVAIRRRYADGNDAETRAGSRHEGSSSGRVGRLRIGRSRKSTARTDGHKTLSRPSRCPVPDLPRGARPSRLKEPRFRAIGLCRRQAETRTLGDEGGTAMRILLAVDGSRSADRARDLVAALPWLEAALRIVRSSPRRPTSCMPWAFPLDRTDEIGRRTPSGHTATPSRLPNARSGPPVATSSSNPSSLRGRAASVIVEEAREDGGGSRRRRASRSRRWESMLLGSVSAEVVDHAPCPVLVARDERLGPVVFADDGSSHARAAEVACPSGRSSRVCRHGRDRGRGRLP